MGMSCTGCKTMVQKLLSDVPGIKNVSVDLQNKEATIEMENHIPTTQLQSALKDHPKYQLEEKSKSNNSHIQNTATDKEPAGLHEPVRSNSIQDKIAGEYYCPMHCEGDKTYDKPGDCPVCGMHLEKIPSVQKKL